MEVPMFRSQIIRPSDKLLGEPRFIPVFSHTRFEIFFCPILVSSFAAQANFVLRSFFRLRISFRDGYGWEGSRCDKAALQSITVDSSTELSNTSENTASSACPACFK